jgi:hypothetical protein
MLTSAGIILVRDSNNILDNEKDKIIKKPALKEVSSNKKGELLAKKWLDDSTKNQSAYERSHTKY